MFDVLSCCILDFLKRVKESGWCTKEEINSVTMSRCNILMNG